jgi:hypothetical protein
VAIATSLFLVTLAYPLFVNLTLALLYLHVPSTAVYGYYDSNSIPLAAVYSNAQKGQPPSHPWFPNFYEQSTNCYSENDNKLLLLMKFNPSNDPVVENAQHEPHCP